MTMNRDTTARPTQRVGLDSLRLGERLATDLYDSEGVLLLSAGAVVTGEDLSRLEQRGLVYAHTRAPAQPLATATERLRRKLDAMFANPRACVVPTAPKTVQPRRTLSLQSFKDEVAAGVKHYEASTATYEAIAEDIEQHRLKTTAAAEEVINPFIDMLRVDSDLLPTLCLFRDQTDDYLFRHSLNVSLLSITLGEAVGLNDEQLRELGIGTLLMDLGMLKVPPELRQAERRLRPDEWYEIRRHPTHTLDMLEKLSGVSPRVMLLGYQCHERGDGSGYPRHRKQMLVHTYSRIAAIADSYAAMTAERPHRVAQTPYDAMRTLLTEGAANKFDRAILRSFVDRMSLFPIGSYVQLSTGDLARVIRANPGLHTKPIVVVVGANGVEQDRSLNLARTTNVQITQAFGVQCPMDARAVF